VTRRKGMTAAFALAAGSIVLDQITKRLVISGLDPLRPVHVIDDVLKLMLRFNEGAAFSFSWGGPMVLTVLGAAAAVFITVLLVRCNRCTTLTYLALGAVLGGALGNLVDRIVYGRVVDFIDMGIGGWRWPTFNVADVSIVVGGVLLLIFHRTGEKDPGGEGGSGR
jgi:signal peptidase II